ncbi:hypothetical protein HZS61_003240 [Fusarium oxysporum f. sp. conglutinans]|uniref:BTB domain-containing protein n=2 Tax=Fusarium oxysporum f. sp. conglutinans TaxID=100902 RepID=A0A8H6GG23_FUSOX|nr:hypothetical protein FOXB_00143 [Fusarium oxysporum f. sp. conglutinans Fo5176]KAF6517679.1 hypothetical protein HZS61_003240 [Fusarium oxysporum f. sp. conglutinans]KAG6989254.1 hypothetical protein FocnCong_v020792 [Fusarium oxysporum f. sp. conglutinans]KAI8404505.1 hypothetical protein FOFC_16000 [Fusarium oxysporum]
MISKHDIDTKEQMEEWKKWVSELLKTSDYSDLHLLSGNKTYNAHRAVVFYHSAYIQNSHSRNDKNRTINGQFFGPTPFFTFEAHRDTRAVDCVVQYFYRWDYEIPGHARDAKVHTGMMYKEDACDSTEDVISLDGSDLITHVRIFAMADKYGIHPLKSLSVAKFEAAAHHFEKTGYFVKAAREAYDSGVSDDAREMRDSVVEFIYKRRYLLLEDHIKKLMLDEPQLSLDLHLRCPVDPVNPSSFHGLGRVFP